MKNQIVADGRRRFFWGRVKTISESIEQKYAADMANAGPEEKAKIREQMAEEILRREKMFNHKPSPGSLW
jgi:hypothetical protein